VEKEGLAMSHRRTLTTALTIVVVGTLSAVSGSRAADDVEIDARAECSFDAIVHKYGLDSDPAMVLLARIVNGAVGSNKIANSAVGTAKITNAQTTDPQT